MSLYNVGLEISWSWIKIVKTELCYISVILRGK